MKVFRKGLGLILGGLMAISMIGCSNKIEQGEELLKENIQQDIKRNIKEYQPKYNELDDSKKLRLDLVKDIDKINVDIEELEDVFEATITLGYKDTDIEDCSDTFVIEFEKDKLTKENLENEDFLYSRNNLRKVVASKSIIKNSHGELLTWLYCEEGYEGNTKNYKDENNTILIMDNWDIEKDFFFYLGNLKFDI